MLIEKIKFTPTIFFSTCRAIIFLSVFSVRQSVVNLKFKLSQYIRRG